MTTSTFLRLGLPSSALLLHRLPYHSFQGCCLVLLIHLSFLHLFINI